jgi:phosphoribulokinase
MSAEYPIIAVTGSSGAGTTTVKVAFEHMFFREGVTATTIEGDSFHRYNREQMRKAVAEHVKQCKRLSHFGPEGNVLDELEQLFIDYGATGTGKRRRYVHNPEEAALYGAEPGTFTEWEQIESGSDILLYEGLHGGFVSDEVNVAEHVDLLIGVVPIVNLEWIQKIHRDHQARGYDTADITTTILRRMRDYVEHITPQFSITDINFQRVPLVDTSNPFVARDIPTLDESMVVIRFQEPKKFNINFPYLLAVLHGSWMSRRNTIVVPGGKMIMAMEVILSPIIHRLVAESARRRRTFTPASVLP